MQNILHFIDIFWRAIRRFFASAWVSLGIIIVFVLLLTQMDQGSIIFIHLLESPINTALFLMISHLLALVLSLYPVYLTKWRDNNYMWDNTTWKKLNDPFGIGMGIIVYEDKHPVHPDTYKLESILRKFLGVLFYLGLLYCVMYMGNLYFNFPPNWLFYVLAGLFIAFNYWLSKTERAKHVGVIAQVLPIFLIVSVALFIATYISSIVLQWHWISHSLLFFQLFFSTIHFILFRRYRSLLTTENKATFPYKQLSNNQYYLQLTSFGGWLSLLILVVAQFKYNWFNPAVIILCLFYTVYGIIIIPIKHFFYYRSNAEAKEINVFHTLANGAFAYIFPFFWVGFIAWNIATSMIGNNLHELDQIETSNNFISSDEFVTDIQQYFESKDTVYFIASSGGGLRANIWTQLILEKLANTKQADSTSILESTIAISGVSGGALGSAFYTSLHHQEQASNFSSEKRREIIETIGQTNFLSADVSWAFVSDYLRELVPFKVWGHDRAIESMQNYEQLISEQATMSTTDFQSYWANVYRNKKAENKFFPALVLNSSSYNEKRGIAFSVRTDEAFEQFFPDAINILRLPNGKTLSYLQAISPSNRFPIFSPGADIPGKGIFLDGGYFENSGMMSSWDLYLHLKEQLPEFFASKKVVFLQIQNGKTAYTRELISPFQDSITIHVKDMGELSSIAKTVLSTTMVSEYVQERLQQDTSIIYQSIFLPYKIEKVDVKKLFFTQSLPPAVEAVININNAEIDSLFTDYKDWEYAEPPLGRLLTDKAVNYMDIVLNRDDELFSINHN